jgi:integration host factor subunit beta
VTKKELIERITDRSGVNRIAVKRTVQEFLDQIIAELKKGNRLEFRDFGVFEVKSRAARQAQNPKTLARVTVPSKRTVKFKAGRLMRESVEGHSTAPASERHIEKPDHRVPEIKVVERVRANHQF